MEHICNLQPSLNYCIWLDLLVVCKVKKNAEYQSQEFPVRVSALLTLSPWCHLCEYFS